ncbi:AmmeMemoRadiSam system radical SAM enzyme [Spirochaetia bacterium 38H-sp]|uniref:AmmeMemoRadiSam system radical SAM enzyme n=1 Tax=Rarispira pelagica TaxID=3141764 RepID=A0ABU9UBQ7_9SPIR
MRTDFEASYYTRLDEGKVRCELCPHFCVIAEGKIGICGVRRNQAGRLMLPYYGMISSIAMDPIEKKPLYHFFPGSVIMSVGFVGCPFRCPFCQNYSISIEFASLVSSLSFFEPQELVDRAIALGSMGIAYTYSEPLIHAEFITEAARLARKRGLKNVLVTNGYINPAPAEDILEHMDAANIDLKSFNADFYSSFIRGKIEPVKAFILQAAKKIHVEVTTLLIPGKNDSDEEIRDIAKWVAAIRDDIPLHLTAYYPRYHYTQPPTPPSRVLAAVDIAKKYLRHVYPGNI